MATPAALSTHQIGNEKASQSAQQSKWNYEECTAKMSLVEMLNDCGSALNIYHIKVCFTSHILWNHICFKIPLAPLETSNLWEKNNSEKIPTHKLRHAL